MSNDTEQVRNYPANRAVKATKKSKLQEFEVPVDVDLHVTVRAKNADQAKEFAEEIVHERFSSGTIRVDVVNAYALDYEPL